MFSKHPLSLTHCVGKEKLSDPTVFLENAIYFIAWKKSESCFA